MDETLKEYIKAYKAEVEEYILAIMRKQDWLRPDATVSFVQLQLHKEASYKKGTWSGGHNVSNMIEQAQKEVLENYASEKFQLLEMHKTMIDFQKVAIKD
jgi:hypothetical protein